MWPTDVDSLTAYQERLATAVPEPWLPDGGPLRVGGCWVCFPRDLDGPGAAGDPAWAAAVLVVDGKPADECVTQGVAGAPYVPGLLALRLGPLMEQAIRCLKGHPDVLLVDATGRDHPRGAGLAVHLGSELELPTVGVTHRPLRAEGAWPEDRRGATSLLRIGDDVVACWLRTRPGTRPLVVHPGWRVDLATAVDLVLDASPHWRTPEPLRRARNAAREGRAGTQRATA